MRKIDFFQTSIDFSQQKFFLKNFLKVHDLFFLDKTPEEENQEEEEEEEVEQPSYLIISELKNNIRKLNMSATEFKKNYLPKTNDIIEVYIPFFFESRKEPYEQLACAWHTASITEIKLFPFKFPVTEVLNQTGLIKVQLFGMPHLTCILPLRRSYKVGRRTALTLSYIRPCMKISYENTTTDDLYGEYNF